MSTWITGRCCITKFPAEQIINGICPDCRAEYQASMSIDELNRVQRSAATSSGEPKPRTISREEAILTAARELSHGGATITMVIRRAGKILGKGLSTGYLSPSGGGYHLRAQVEEILGPAPVDPVAALKAEVARLQAELATAQATPKPAPVSWVDGLRDELAKDRHTLVQIEQDRAAVFERIQAAELLLSTLEDEPTERWEVLQGGAHDGEVA